MKLIHYTNKPFYKFKNRSLNINLNPVKALWLYCNNDLINWTKRENMALNYKYKYTFDIDKSKLIILKTYNDIQDFTIKYRSNKKITISDKKHYIINWNKVNKDYSGIFIKNLNIKKAQEDFIWYYSFDVCSVAIWNKNAIIDFYEKCYAF
jgi:hypothetical protein